MGNNVLINHLHQFQDFEDDWNEIFRNSTTHSPFLSFSFVDLWYRCFAKPDQIRIFRAVHQGKTIGFLPLIMKRQHGIRILTNLINDHCLHGGALVRNGFEDAFPSLILNALLHHDSAWDLFNYGFTYSFFQYPGLFPEEMLNETGYRWQRSVQPTFTIRLENAFDDYFRVDLSSSTRRLIERKKKQLKNSGKFSYRHFRGEEALRMWSEFVRIEDSGWKGTAGTSIARLDDRYQRYYKGYMELLARLDALHLFFLELNGRNIAGGFGYVEERVFHWAKAGYDEEYGYLSPSNLLLMHVVEDLMTNCPDMKILNQFPWDCGYKQKFNNERSYCFETVIYNHTLRGKVAQLCPQIKALFKKFKRSDAQHRNQSAR